MAMNDKDDKIIGDDLAQTPRHHPDTDPEGNGAAGAARLREGIDRGGTGDKVAFSDPAAAPLGTDAEAGGAPPTMEQVRRAEAAETRRDVAEPEKSHPADRQNHSGGRWAIWAVAIIVLAVLIWAMLGR